MRDNSQEKGDTNEVREAETFVLTFPQVLGDMLDAWGIPSSGGMQKEATLLEQRNVVPKSSGVVKHAAPL